MTELTKLIKTPGSSTGDILSVGGEMLLCTLCSAVLAVGCGYLSARTAAGFQLFRAPRPVPPRDGRGQRGDADLLRPQPHHAHDQRHHSDPDDRRDGPADAHEGPDHGRVGRDQDPRQELDALGRDGGLRRGAGHAGAAHHVELPAPVPQGAERRPTRSTASRGKI